MEQPFGQQVPQQDATEYRGARRFVGEHDTFEEIAYIDGGQTAKVYRVRRLSDNSEWALKLLRAPEYRSRFFQEVITLRLLASELGILRDDDDHLLVPEVADKMQEGEDQFFVMTLAHGHKLDNYLREQGRLSEVDGLEIVIQTAHVFAALHERLNRSYHDFQPQNVFWDDEARQVLVLDWNLLSSEGDMDVPGDVRTLGRLLYRALVGQQLPAAGVTAMPGWHELTLGVQTILRKATHRDPARSYASMADLVTALENQLAIWETPANDLYMTASQKWAAHRALPDESEHLPERHQPLSEAYNCIQVLERRRHELSEYTRDEPFLNLQQNVVTAWGGNGLFAAGLRILETNDLAGAQSCFRQIVDGTDDAAEQVSGQRWLWAAETVDAPARAQMIEANQLADDHKLESALSLAQDAADGRGQEAAQQLLASLEAQAAWQNAQRLAEQAENQGTATAYRATADAYKTTQGHLQALPELHRAALARLWGDASAEAARMRVKAEEIEMRSVDVDNLERSIKTYSPSKAVDRLALVLEGNPRDASVVKLGLELARGWLQDVSHEDREPDVIPEARRLVDKVLPHAEAEGMQDRLLREWRTADALERSLSLLDETPVDRARLAREFTRINVSGSQTNNAIVLGFLAARAMERAEQSKDLPLATLAAETASNKRAEDGVPVLTERKEQLAIQLREETTQSRADFRERIAVAAAAATVPTLQEALALIDAQLALASIDDDEWRSELTDRRADLSRRLKLAQMRTEFDGLVAEVDDATDKETLVLLASQLDHLQMTATASAEAIPGAEKLAAECQSESSRAIAKSSRIDDVLKQQALIRGYLGEYERLRDDQSPAAHVNKLMWLAAARQLAEENDLRAESLPELQGLLGEVDAAWTAERTPSDTGASLVETAGLSPQSDESVDEMPAELRESLAEITAAVAGIPQQVTGGLQPVIEQSQKDAAESGKRDPWLFGLLGTVLLILLLLGLLDVLREGRALNRIAGAVDSVATEVAAGSEASGGRLETILPAQIAPLQGEVGTLGDQVSELSTRVIIKAEDEMLAARMTMTATVQAIENAASEVAAMQAEASETQAALHMTAESVTDAQAQIETKETQLKSLETRVSTGMADLDSQRKEVQDLAESIESTATALAAKLTSVPTRVASADQADEGEAAVEPSEKPRPTTTPEPTQTPEPTVTATSSTVQITFPTDGAQLFTAPWQIVVSGKPWLADVTQYRLKLNDAVLAEYTQQEEGEPIVYQRVLEDAFDDFLPIVSGEETLNLDENRQLPPGAYVVTVEALIGDDAIVLHQDQFSIRGDRPTKVVRALGLTSNLIRRPLPSDAASAGRLPGPLTGDDSALALGKAVGPYQGDPNRLWCYWEAIDNPRRGWTLCEFLATTEDTSITVDQIAETIPDLAWIPLEVEAE